MFIQDNYDEMNKNMRKGISFFDALKILIDNGLHPIENKVKILMFKLLCLFVFCL